MSTNRFKKSQKQIQILQNYYIQYPKWTNQTIHQIEKHSKLPRDKIYKWYWDQNKKLMPKNKQDQPIDVEIQCKGNLLVSSTNQILSCTGVSIDKENWNIYGDRLGLKLLCYIGCSYLIQFQLLQSDYIMKQNKIIYCYYQRLRHHSDTSKRLLKENYELREYYYRIQSKYYTRIKDKFENNKKRIQFFVGMVAFLSLSPVYNCKKVCSQFSKIVLQGFEKSKDDLGFKIKSLIYGQELFLHPCFVEHNFKPNIDQELLKTFREIDELMPIGFTHQYLQSVCECLNIPHNISEQYNKSISPKQFDSIFKNIDTQQVIQAIKQVQNKELQSQMRMLK